MPQASDLFLYLSLFVIFHRRPSVGEVLQVSAVGTEVLTRRVWPQVMAFLHKNGAVDQESLSIEDDADSKTAQVHVQSEIAPGGPIHSS